MQLFEILIALLHKYSFRGKPPFRNSSDTLRVPPSLQGKASYSTSLRRSETTVAIPAINGGVAVWAICSNLRVCSPVEAGEVACVARRRGGDPA